MRFACVAVLALFIPFAGCSSPDAGTGANFPPSAFQADACDSSGATTRNHDAPLVAGMQDRKSMARKVVEAVGDKWTTDTPERDNDDLTIWPTRDGKVTAHGAAGETGVSYRSPLETRFSTPHVLAAAKAVGIAEDGQLYVYNQDRYGSLAWAFPGQGYDGHWAWRLPSAKVEGSLTAGPIHDLTKARAVVTEAAALETAKAYTRCVMDREGDTVAAGYRFVEMREVFLTAHDDSFAYVVVLAYTEPEESHCGYTKHPAIDAVTGAALGLRGFYCD